MLSFLSELEEGSISRALKVRIVELCELRLIFARLVYSDHRAVYNDLTHPAATYVDAGHAWRTADGSGNNPDLPEMGKVRLKKSTVNPMC